MTRAVWMAASNALADLRAPGFAVALLREAPLSTSVLVIDAGKFPRGAAGSLMLSSSSLQLPAGFPPGAVYWLTAEAAQGEDLASNGPTPIYLGRAVITPGVTRQINWPMDATCVRCQINCPECQEERAKYLAALARMPSDEGDRVIEPQVAVVWSTAAQLQGEISRALAEQEARVRELVRRLAAAGAIENSELGMTLHIGVRIEDQRGDRSVSLPAYPTVEFRIE